MVKLALNFSHTFAHKIWDITVSVDGRILILEVRDAGAMQASFHILDTVSRQFLHKELVFAENWWISVNHVTSEKVVFHTYQGENPDEKEYFSFNIKSADILDIDEDTALKSANFDKNNSVVLPFHYTEGTEYFNTVQQFVLKVKNHKIERALDYYENDECLILAYYYQLHGQLANNLLITDMEGNIVFEEILGSQLSGISDYGFFISNNNIIFVKDSTHFLIYQL